MDNLKCSICGEPADDWQEIGEPCNYMVTDDAPTNLVICSGVITTGKFELGDKVVHPEIYWGNETFEVVGIRKDQLELHGDWSGGTNPNTAGPSWHKLEGTVLKSRKRNV